MTNCDHRLLRLWRVSGEQKIYCCGICNEPFLTTLTPVTLPKPTVPAEPQNSNQVAPVAGEHRDVV